MQKTLGIWRFGLALGITLALLHSFIVLILYMFTTDVLLSIINNEFHGFIGDIIKNKLEEGLPGAEQFALSLEMKGIILDFILGSLIGTLLASFYNLLSKIRL
jgi:hypothetical protein